MSTLTEVIESLFGEVSSFASSNGGLPIAWPEVDFDPPNEGQWLEVSLLIDDSEDYGLAKGEGAIMRGTLRIGVCDKPGGGSLDSLSIASLIQANWQKSKAITGTNAIVESTPSISSPLVYGDSITVYSSIRWWYTL